MNILLAVDGSPHTKKMLAYLATHIESLGTHHHFTALTVEPPLPPRAQAIVGAEVLPNRNRPMTALPTLIEHAPGQKTPILHFEKRQPILDLIEKLGKKARKLKPESLQERLEGDSHLQDALQKLHQTRSIAEAYQGEEAIFDFLAWLNDLVRLSAALKVPFPFEAYAGVADFPRIEVEFFHLRNQNQAGQGKFMILDTPGFNEAGQKEHRPVCRPPKGAACLSA